MAARNQSGRALPCIAIWAICSFTCYGQSPVNRIQPFTDNRQYWQFKGEPAMLLGANATDSPYLLSDQEAYYDSLVSLGGNFTRYNVKQRFVPDLVQLLPHKLLADGRYDLERWEKEYWDRFEQGLIMTRDRNIIVQLELWDRFDVGCEKYYHDCAWRPANNITYTASESGLPDEWSGCDQVVHNHPFFHTVHETGDNRLLLGLQKKFADKVLSITLEYDHVLYVITNESTLSPGWSDFWAKHIRAAAGKAGVNVEVSEMPWTIAGEFPFPWQQPVLKNPDLWVDHVIQSPLYSFCAFQYQPILHSGQEHYDRITAIMDRVKESVGVERPVNAVKVFARERIIGGEQEPNAQTRFWRLLMAGWAGVSLHRQHENSGYLGFGSEGRNNLSAARKFCDAILPWECSPRQDLLQNREPDEAYVLANPGKAWGIYFPTSGSVGLDLMEYEGSRFSLKWISIQSGEFYGPPAYLDGSSCITVTTPEAGSNAGWAAVIRMQEDVIP